MRIASNYGVLNQVKRLSNKRDGIKRLASGFRINTAADDSAGLAISEKMRAQIRGLDAAQGNVQDAISLVQTADGALTEVHNILQRVNELSVRAANGIFTELERDALHSETEALLRDVDRIAAGTTFNGIHLLDGSCAEIPGVTIDPVYASYSAEIDLSPVRDGSTIELDGVTFEFDVDGDQRNSGSILVDISTATGSTPADYTARIQGFTSALESSSLSSDYSFTVEDLGNGNMSLQMTAKQPKSGPSLGAQTNTIPDIIHGEIKVNNASPAVTSVSISDIDYNSIVPGNTLVVDNTVFEFTADGTVLNPGAIPIPFRYPLNGVPDYTDFKNQVRNAFNTSPLHTSTRQNIVVAINSTTGIGSIMISDTNPITADRIGSAEFNRPDTISNGMAVSNDVFQPGSEGSFIPGADPKLAFQIGAAKEETLQLIINGTSTESLGLVAVSLLDIESAAKSIDLIRSAINAVSENRSTLGAAHNRLEYTMNNLATSSENMTAAESRIRDADMAKEMMSHTRDGVLLQSAQAMLAQANQQMQGILQLLQ